MLAIVPPAHDVHSVHRDLHRPQRPHPRKPAATVPTRPVVVAPPQAYPRAAPSRPQDTPPRARPDPPPPAPVPVAVAPPPFDVHSYPSPDLLRLLASLLAQIAATNDKLDAAAPATPPSTTPTRTTLATVTPTDAPIWRTLTTASRTSISTPSSVLTFHARNVPTISLEAYLLRILKYCPTTNEVFLSLLVYFDRMSKLSAEATGRTFVIDSYNIHRLVIAGVTVASKFFSDVFYTNSRYAKVGGLPQAELNQLELQFLLLNDFRLVIPRDEMQRYAEQLILFSNSPPDAAPVPAPVAAPMQAMGAIDAYGGRLPSSSSASSSQSHAQKPAQPLANGYPSHASGSNSNKTPRAPPSDAGDDTETETETETETDGGTDGGWTTDDEPTIRPTHSSAGSSSDDTRSLSSAGEDDTGDEGEFGEDENEGEMEGVESSQGEGEGDRTPERAFGDRTPERRRGLETITRAGDGARTPARRDRDRDRGGRMATSP